MRALIQRVQSASVKVDERIISKTGKGLLVMIGIGHGDSDAEISTVVEKVTNMRIFEGETGKLDLSVMDISGEILVVSQFTLYGECNRGRRPDFTAAAGIEEAREVYGKIVQAFRATGLKIGEGEFQAYMQVELINDGPVTLMLDVPKKNFIR